MLDLAKLDVFVDVEPKRKKTNARPTQRTLKELRRLGYAAKVVEKWNPHARILQDLWGADVLALGKGHVLVVQTSTGSHHSERVKKFVESKYLDLWKENGVRVEVWTWSKQCLPCGRGARKVWTVRREIL